MYITMQRRREEARNSLGEKTITGGLDFKAQGPRRGRGGLGGRAELGSSWRVPWYKGGAETGSQAKGRRWGWLQDSGAG